MSALTDGIDRRAPVALVSARGGHVPVEVVRVLRSGGREVLLGGPQRLVSAERPFWSLERALRRDLSERSEGEVARLVRSGLRGGRVLAIRNAQRAEPSTWDVFDLLAGEIALVLFLVADDPSTTAARDRVSTWDSALVLETSPACPLTPREHQVLRHVRRGRTTQQIARDLDVRGTTVETHVRSAMDKLGASTRLQAAVGGCGCPPGISGR